jgi:hypothetical protein
VTSRHNATPSIDGPSGPNQTVTGIFATDRTVRGAGTTGLIAAIDVLLARARDAGALHPVAQRGFRDENWIRGGAE